MLTDYASYSVRRDPVSGANALDWQSPLDLVRFWQSCLSSFKPFRPYASCSLFYDFDGFQPRGAKHHILRSRRSLSQPGTGLVVAAPFLRNHPRQRMYTYSQIVHVDPDASQRRLQQEPDPDWNDFVQMAFWHEGELAAVLGLTWQAEHGAPSEEVFNLLEHLYPLIDGGIATLHALETERLHGEGMRAALASESEPLMLVGADGSLLFCNEQAYKACSVWNQALPRDTGLGPMLPDDVGSLLSCCDAAGLEHDDHDNDRPHAGPRASARNAVTVRHPLRPHLGIRIEATEHMHALRRQACYILRSIDTSEHAHPGGRRSLHDALPADPLQKLTPRERIVARMVSEGLGNDDIARRLNRSRRTVESQLVSVFRKLEVRSRVQVLRILN